MNRWIEAIPLRITVTGTRGKSSVVRLVASMLRENGKTVLAKTTGSEAKCILPDGSECDVPRRGMPSIVEQKKLLRKAAQLHVDCLIAEVMSIYPENHYVESQQLLKPHIVLITNIRLDHTDAMGKTKDEIAAVYSLDIPEKATVFIPAEENRNVFLEAAEMKNATIIAVEQDQQAAQLASDFKSPNFIVSENLELVASVGHYLGIDRAIIVSGIQNARQDIGGLKIWKYQSKESSKICYLVNAFAANDPQSTMEILSLVKNNIFFHNENFIGLLNLRADRGDRTLQWIDALKNESGQHFQKLFIMGAHTRSVKRAIKSIFVIKDNQPEQIMEMIFSIIENKSVIFGFGNIGGNGKLLIDYWNKIGEAYGV